MADEVAFLAAKWGVPTAVALLFVAMRILFSTARWTLRSLIRAVLVGMAVGNIAALWAQEWGFSAAQKFTAIAVCAILAEDIVATLLDFGRRFRADPAATLESVREIIRGRKP